MFAIQTINQVCVIDNPGIETRHCSEARMINISSSLYVHFESHTLLI